MEIGPSSSVQGIRNAIDTHSARAERLSKAADSEGIEKDMAELPSDPKSLGMQTKVIKAQDDMLGTLLDLLA